MIKNKDKFNTTFSIICENAAFTHEGKHYKKLNKSTVIDMKTKKKYRRGIDF